MGDAFHTTDGVAGGCPERRADAMVAEMTARPKPLVLIVLDGYGERQEQADNAIRLARAPVLKAIFDDYPRGLIGTSGPAVGVGRSGTVAGRFWAMDRDNRWERVERAYRAIAEGGALRAESALQGVE